MPGLPDTERITGRIEAVRVAGKIKSCKAAVLATLTALLLGVVTRLVSHFEIRAALEFGVLTVKNEVDFACGPVSVFFHEQFRRGVVRI